MKIHRVRFWDMALGIFAVAFEKRSLPPYTRVRWTWFGQVWCIFATKARKSMIVETSFAGALVRECTDRVLRCQFTCASRCCKGGRVTVPRSRKFLGLVMAPLLGRASSEPHSYSVDLAFCHDIGIYIGIDRPAAVFDPAPGVKVIAAGTLRANHCKVNMLLYVSRQSPSDRTLSEFTLFAFDCQHWTHSANKFRTSQKCNRVKEAGISFASRPARIQPCSFVFRFTCPTKKPIRRNNAVTAIHCRVASSSAAHWQLSDLKGRLFFVDRQLSYSSLSRYNWVLAANDCRFQVKYFLERSSSFSLASASRVRHDNESWHVRQRAYFTLQTPTTSKLVRQWNSCVGWWCTQKTVPQQLLVDRLWFSRSFLIKSRAREFSRSAETTSHSVKRT